ncbi:tyrosinase family protein [Streptomyces sp. NPDC091272]|uniref:tyrosinase family protein n=1 Tax=Streptomyces sp. NPDC091272 TaxID=3365981 RepID=UPI00381AF04E
MYTRKNQRNLTRTEKQRLVAAFLELKRSGRYDEFVSVHVQYYTADGETGPRAAHSTPSFFPWHRQFLLEFEQALRTVDPSVSLPYWDWTTDNTPAASLWADDFLGGNGRKRDQQVMTGPFAHANGHWQIAASVTEDRFLTRNFGGPKGRVTLPTKEDVAWATRDAVYDSAPWDSTATGGFRNKLEGWATGNADKGNNHNRVHRWVGGVMLGGASPNDPVFWLHHAFVDLLWLRWQKAHPRSGYQPAGPLDANDPQKGRIYSLNETMPPWNMRPAQLLDHSGLYRYA